MDNIPSELLRNGGEATTTVLAAICQKICEMKEWMKEWTQSLDKTFTGERQQCQNYCVISLISHSGKIMLRVILNRLKAKAEELLTEQQPGFRPGRSAAAQIFKSRVIIGKHLQHQCVLFHDFIDFKIVFDRVWHASLRQVPRSLNIVKV